MQCNIDENDYGKVTNHNGQFQRSMWSSPQVDCRPLLLLMPAADTSNVLQPYQLLQYSVSSSCLPMSFSLILTEWENEDVLVCKNFFRSISLFVHMHLYVACI